MAQYLNISISSIYYERKKYKEDKEIKPLIEEILKDNPSYGHKRIALKLNLNKKRILRIMHKYDIKPYRRRRFKLIKLDDYGKEPAIYKNEIKDLKIIRPNQVWESDFTYIKYRGCFIYLATLIDVYAKNIVGFNISSRHNTELVLIAFENALLNHKSPDISHSDQGSEYESLKYTEFLEKVGVKISMSSKGSPWQNGYQESFYSNFKIELGDPNRFETKEDLIITIMNQIYYYNNERIHTSLKSSPNLFLENFYKKMGT